MTIHHGLRAAAGNVGESDTLVTDDLVFHLDASNSNSYGGSGNTWSDISGNGNDHSLNSSLGNQTFLLWQYVSAGDASYFNQHMFNNAGVHFLTGVASNSYGVTGAATVEIWMMSESTTWNTVFKFFNNTSRALMTHINYGSSSGDDYFDVNGCCSAYQRISGSYTDSNFYPFVRQYVWRYRPGTTPEREIMKNTVSIHDSGTYSTYGGTWNNTAANYFGNRMDGRWYIIRFYKKALTDAEITTNFDRDKARFGIS